jgi:hypothetical protein
LESYGKVEAVPKLEGKRMIVNISPKKWYNKWSAGYQWLPEI